MPEGRRGVGVSTAFLMVLATSLATSGLFVAVTDDAPPASEPQDGAAPGALDLSGPLNVTWRGEPFLEARDGVVRLVAGEGLLLQLARDCQGVTVANATVTASFCTTPTPVPGPAGPIGPPGPPGNASFQPILTMSIPLQPGEVCTEGGHLLLLGSDDGDGIATAGDHDLHADEVDVEVPLCNGVRGDPGPAGPVGPPGPQGATPLPGPAGPPGFDTLVAVETLADGEGACAAGGFRIRHGVDDGAPGGVAGDGMLQSQEALDTQPLDICHADADGNTGPAGAVTLASSDTNVGSNCSDGGIRIRFGLDDGTPTGVAGDGTLQDGEVHEGATQYVCNGKDASSQSGADGNATILSATTLQAGTDDECPRGGTRFHSGLDDGTPTGVAQNGQLEGGEVDDTWVSCVKTDDVHHHWLHPYPQPPARQVVAAGAAGYLDMTLGPTGLPILAVVKDTALHIVYCLEVDCSAAETAVPVASGVANHSPSIALAADGTATVVYAVQAANSLAFVKCADFNCTQSTARALASGNAGGNLRLATGVDGNPLVAFTVLGAPDRFFVLHCTAPDCATADAPVSLQPSLAAIASDIAIGLDGRPIITYRDASTAKLRLARCNDVACSGAAHTIVHDTLQQQGGIGIDMQGLPIMAFIDGDNTLKIAFCPSETCAGATIQQVDSGLDFAQEPRITIGLDGRPTVAYQKGGLVRLLHCLDTQCTRVATSVVDATTDPWIFMALVTGLDGAPRVAYATETGRDIVVHTARNPFGVPGWWRRG